MSNWLMTLVQQCPGLIENNVVVSFDNGCATEMRFSSAPYGDFIACMSEKLSSVRWTCHDLVCASAMVSTLP